tara:strand:- start:193 stop:396 length:204 start_codon:yes stop_codon:yes gene_type:complete
LYLKPSPISIDPDVIIKDTNISKKASKKPVVTVFRKDDKIEFIRSSPKESLIKFYYIKKKLIKKLIF